MVSYKGKDGKTHYEYYDYIEDKGNITVLQKSLDESKEGVYQDTKTGISLDVRERDDGEQECFLGEMKLEGTPEMGYILKAPEGEKIKVKSQKYICGTSQITLVSYEMPNGSTIYFADDVATTDVDMNVWTNGGLHINGKLVSPGIEDYNKELDSVVFGPMFADKGTTFDTGMPSSSDKDLEVLKSDAEQKKADKEAKDEVLAAAQDRLKTANANWDEVKGTEKQVSGDWENAKQALESARGVVDAARKPYEEAAGENKVSEYLKGLINIQQGSVASLLETLNKEKENVGKSETQKKNADKISTDVNIAYQKVVAAIERLSSLTPQEDLDESGYNVLVKAYDKAVEEYTEALRAKGASERNLAQIEAAAERARTAADAVFEYKTSDDGNTGETGNDGTGSGGGSGTGSGSGEGGGTGSGSGEGTGTGSGEGGGSEGGAGTGGSSSGSSSGGSSSSSSSSSASDTDAVAPAVPETAPAEAAPAAVTLAAGVNNAAVTPAADESDAAGTQDAGENAGLQRAGDEEVPLAAAPNAEAGGEEQEKATLNAADEEVPLAASETAKQRMSWWWLLIVLLLGVTGEEMYRRHQKKLRETEE